MSNREKILRFYRGSEGEETAAKLVDAAEKAMKNQKFRLTAFLDPFGQEIAEVVAANFEGLAVSFNGGYAGAERQRAVFQHEDFRGTPSWEIAVVEAQWKDAFAHISHRDVLGAIMSLGIEREIIGDIQIQQGAVRIVTAENMADFLLTNCVQFGAAHVTCSLGELSALLPREERCKEIRFPARRLDCGGGLRHVAQPGCSGHRGGKAQAQLAVRKERLPSRQGGRCAFHARQGTA